MKPDRGCCSDRPVVCFSTRRRRSYWRALRKVMAMMMKRNLDETRTERVVLQRLQHERHKHDTAVDGTAVVVLTCKDCHDLWEE